jgi:hypothetical protein
MFFLLFLLDDRGIRIRISDMRIREAQKQMDPMDPDSDPDPQHCLHEFCVVAGCPGAARQEVRHGGEHQAGPHEAEALAPAGPDQGPPEAAGHLHHVSVSFSL